MGGIELVVENHPEVVFTFHATVENRYLARCTHFGCGHIAEITIYPDDNDEVTMMDLVWAWQSLEHSHEV